MLEPNPLLDYDTPAVSAGALEDAGSAGSSRRRSVIADDGYSARKLAVDG